MVECWDNESRIALKPGLGWCKIGPRAFEALSGSGIQWSWACASENNEILMSRDHPLCQLSSIVGRSALESEDAQGDMKEYFKLIKGAIKQVACQAWKPGYKSGS